MPAATWHMVGFVQLFFIHSSICTASFEAVSCYSTIAWHLCAMACPLVLKWTNERKRHEKAKTKTSIAVGDRPNSY
jgi:hypothetical protein